MAKKRYNCSAYLKLKIPRNDNLMGLSRERYELTDCDYGFHQGINRAGEVCTGLKGGVITVAVQGLPSEELLAWMFDHAKEYNGEVTVMDESEETIEQVYFEQARLTDLTLQYKAENKPNMVTKLTIYAENFKINDAYFENLNR